ncbi:pirin family protein [Candidatus Micrarchaeota archaeon]|nr:pirin family protein [Candidatus Micrarchaeota archaeon]
MEMTSNKYLEHPPMVMPAPVFRIQRASERYFASHGWLQTFHSFSFADYYDPENLNWGALRVLNDDVVAPKRGFEPHPHRDMEILTYVLSGELTHEDSMSHKGVVKPGCVQYMSAGTGVVHSEKNLGNAPLHLLQMWVVPDRRGHAPQYGQLDLAEDDRTDKLLLVASGTPSQNAPIRLHQDASFYIAKLEKKTQTHAFGNGRLGFLFVASGQIRANDEALKTGDAVRMADVGKLELSGTGDVVLWDLPYLPV